MFRIFSLLILLAPIAMGQEWTFSHVEKLPEISVGQGSLTQELGLTVIRPTGGDCTITLPSVSFHAEEKPFFAYRYRMISQKTQAGLFFITDTLTELSDKSYSPFPVNGDGKYHNVILDMRTFPHGQWKGKVKQVRLDPTNPSDTNSEITFSRLGFFTSREAAEQFLNAADDTPDYSQKTVLSAPFQKVTIPGGSLADGWKRDDFLLKNTLPMEGENPAEIVVVEKGNVVPCETNSRGFTRFIADHPGVYTQEHRPQTWQDIAEHPLENAIRYVTARGKMTGTDATHFSPNAKDAAGKTRAEVARELYRQERETLGMADLSDVAPLPKNRLRVGAWGHFATSYFDEPFFHDIVDCGFDFLILTSHGTEDVFHWADRHGVELICNDGAWKTPAEQTAAYFDHPSFGGTYLCDEPGSDQYDEYAKICDDYQHALPGKIPFINLLPMYANAAQLKYGAGADTIDYYDADPQLYRKYCDAYCEKVPTNYICTDIYPLRWNGKEKATYRDYLESIRVIADSARRHNKEFWCCIQTFAWTKSVRTPTESEFRWQCYSLLSFGCRAILCWTYAGSRENFPSLVDFHGKKTPTWDAARPVMWEMRALSPVYSRYRNLGAFCVRSSDDLPYTKLQTPLPTPKLFQQILTDDPVLVGYFEENDGDGKAFTLVNMSDLKENQTIEVRVKLDASKVTIEGQARKEITPSVDGFYTFTLQSGEGVFVTCR